MNFFLTLVFAFLLPDSIVSFPCSNVTQFAVTFQFSEARECGTYLNGDYWVLADGFSGDLVIDSIDPPLISSVVTNGAPGITCLDTWDYNDECNDYCTSNAPAHHSSYCSGGLGGQCFCANMRNGYEINPVYQGGQAFDSRVGICDPSLLPNSGNFPLTVGPGSSLVKVVSTSPAEETCIESDGSAAMCLVTAVVLTVVGEVPPPDAFRPPYTYESDKTLASDHVRYSELNLVQLPNLDGGWVQEELIERYGDLPTYPDNIPKIERLQLDHKGGSTGRRLHPAANIPDYGASIASRNNHLMLLLCLNATDEDKKSLLVPFLQYGIDLYYVIKNNGSWTSGGGHRPGQKLPLVVAAVIVDKPGWRETVRDHAHFNEEWVTVEGRDEILWGYEASEERYWEYITSEYTSNLELADPYGWIDGGMNSGHIPCGYQTCCTSMSWKGSVLVVLLIPELRDVWNDEEVMMYVDRYVRRGVHTQPDPCARYDGRGEENLGKTFGPDPDRPGECIKWNEMNTPVDRRGRFPEVHGEYANEGHHNSRFEFWMWEGFRSLGTICRYKQGEYDPATDTCICLPSYSGTECQTGGAEIVSTIVSAVLSVVVVVLLLGTIVFVVILSFCCRKRTAKEGND